MDLRQATPPDAEALARTVIDGFGHFRLFAAPGWEPPPLAEELAITHALLPDPDVWCRIAEQDGEIIGQVTLLPAAKSGSPSEEPGLAHLRNLFVREDHWGTGLATELHAAAVDEAAARGYSRMRLFTPVEQRRARRFYEREGWRTAGEAFHAPGADLELIEYRRALAPADAPG